MPRPSGKVLEQQRLVLGKRTLRLRTARTCLALIQGGGIEYRGKMCLRGGGLRVVLQRGFPQTIDCLLQFSLLMVNGRRLRLIVQGAGAISISANSPQ